MCNIGKCVKYRIGLVVLSGFNIGAQKGRFCARKWKFLQLVRKRGVFAHGITGGCTGEVRQLLLDCFQKEADRAETVIATQQGRVGIFHPAVKEVSATAGEHFDIFPN